MCACEVKIATIPEALRRRRISPLISNCSTPIWRQCGETPLDNLLMDLGYYGDGVRASMMVDRVKVILSCKVSLSATWLPAILSNQ